MNKALKLLKAKQSFYKPISEAINSEQRSFQKKFDGIQDENEDGTVALETWMRGDTEFCFKVRFPFKGKG